MAHMRFTRDPQRFGWPARRANVKASYNDGILEIRMPVSTEIAQSRKVQSHKVQSRKVQSRKVQSRKVPISRPEA